jgi:hypothetical protein
MSDCQVLAKACHAIPDYQTLMLPVLWRAAQGETRTPEVEERLADEFDVTSDERNQLLPGPRSRLCMPGCEPTPYDPLSSAP